MIEVSGRMYPVEVRYRAVQNEEDEDERNGNLRFARHFATAFLSEALHVDHDDGHVVVAASSDCLVYQLRCAALRIGDAI